MADHEHQHLIGNRLKYGVMLSILVLVIEIFGGVISHSLALLSDAGHVLVDIMALSLSWYGVRQAERPASARMTFGYHRVGVIIALVNVISIFVMAVLIFYEAYRRYLQPPEVNPLVMLPSASVGIIANIIVIFWLRNERKGNINIRSAFWHAAGDTLASVGVIVGAVVILLTGFYVIDPIISVAIGLIIAFAGWSILREGTRILLESTPGQVNVEAMIEAVKKIDGVKGVHDIHVWSISPEIHAMSGHILIDDQAVSKSTDIRTEVEETVRHGFHIEHTVLQMECFECASGDQLFCNLEGPEKACKLKDIETAKLDKPQHEEHGK